MILRSLICLTTVLIVCCMPKILNYFSGEHELLQRKVDLLWFRAHNNCPMIARRDPTELDLKNGCDTWINKENKTVWVSECKENKWIKIF